MAVTHGRRLWLLFAVSLPATLLAIVLCAAALEIWVRARWDVRRGEPGFYASDAVRGERLGENYDGWFAGVRVHINRLGLRDDREYDLDKGSNTFRILVLGDSVTFGHGSVREHTYPFLLEERLRRWRPDVDWQVWNAAVPGYNTTQELEQLLEVGRRFQPDLVIVGFFENDIIDNRPVRTAGAARRVWARTLTVARRHLYSLELYKRIYLTAAWRLSASEGYRRRLQHLSTEATMFNRLDGESLPAQRLTDFERLSDEQVRAVDCVYGMKPNPDTIPAIQRERGYDSWVAAVRRLQDVNRTGRFRLMFFINHAPPTCPDGDVFYDGGSKAIDEFYLKMLGDGAPAVSCYEAFLHVRPSQMPNAREHAIGNANVVKADVLFEFLRDRVLPSQLPTVSGRTRS